MNSIFDPFRVGRFVGFDNMFDRLDRVMETATTKVTWPPYNIAKLTNYAYQLQFALAGFSKDEISVRQEGDHLIVQGSISDKNVSDTKLLYHGIALRDFVVKFLLAENMEVMDVVMDNGILSIEVVKGHDDPRILDFKIKTPFPKISESEDRDAYVEPTSDMMDGIS